MSFILLLFRLVWKSQRSTFSIDSLEQDKWSHESETYSLAWESCWWCQFFQKLCSSTAFSWHAALSFLIWVCCSQFSVSRSLCSDQLDLLQVSLKKTAVVALLFYLQNHLQNINFDWNQMSQFLESLVKKQQNKWTKSDWMCDFILLAFTSDWN